MYKNGPAQVRKERDANVARGDDQNSYFTITQTIRLSKKAGIYPDQQIIVS
jgi:hypothetical protein